MKNEIVLKKIIVLGNFGAEFSEFSEFLLFNDFNSFFWAPGEQLKKNVLHANNPFPRPRQR